jgi:DNA-binding response OmpR family regulator
VVAQGGSVREGREKMAQGCIDAAVVSVPLPDEGAAEMVGELHRANPSIPVLVLSRAEDPEIREEFVGAGASEVLSKECTFVQILTAVRRLGGRGVEALFTEVRGTGVLRSSPGFLGSYSEPDKYDNEDRPRPDGYQANPQRRDVASFVYLPSGGASVRALSTASSATLASMATTDAGERNTPLVIDHLTACCGEVGR